MSADRQRRARVAEQAVSAEPAIAELTERLQQAFAAFAQRLQEGMSSDSDEYRKYQRAIAELTDERRRRAEALMSVQGSIAPPDETTFNSFRITQIPMLKDGPST